MSFDPKIFNFSSEHLELSSGDFKAFLKERYGKKYKAKELNEVHKLRFPSKSEVLKDE